MLASKLRERQFDPDLATGVQSAGDVTIKLQRVLDAQGHVLLYCHSPAREEKDRAMDTAKASGLEAALTKLHASLSKPRGTRDLAVIMQRLGRLKQRYARVAQHFDITVSTAPRNSASAPSPGSSASSSAVPQHIRACTACAPPWSIRTTPHSGAPA